MLPVVSQVVHIVRCSLNTYLRTTFYTCFYNLSLVYLFTRKTYTESTQYTYTFIGVCVSKRQAVLPIIKHFRIVSHHIQTVLCHSRVYLFILVCISIQMWLEYLGSIHHHSYVHGKLRTQLITREILLRYRNTHRVLYNPPG